MGSIDRVDTGWRARWRTPEGQSRSRTFKRKTDAEAHVTAMEHSRLAGAYVDARAGRVLFRDYAAQWLDAQTFDRSSRDATELRLRLHVVPVLGIGSSPRSSRRRSSRGCARSTPWHQRPRR